MTPAIVVVAFNRPLSLINLLNSLADAKYNTIDITLIISIDYCNTHEHSQVVKIAHDFKWNYGPKNVLIHEKNLGLREHILSCGDLSMEHGSVIILEDDLKVSEDFYNYAKRAELYYHEDDNIAGISLYAYEFDEIGWFRFYPNKIGGDTFFMQWAASWGQLWTKKQWLGFRKWYNGNPRIENINIPGNVKNWKKSWKKFYIAYLVEKDLYFVYPYESFTTVRDALANEMGVHYKKESRSNNVQLSKRILNKEYIFSPFLFEILKYDVFFQPTARYVFNNELNKKIFVEFDLFGTKKKENITAPYLCSSKQIDNKIQSYSNKLIPYEDNIIGNEIGGIYNLGKTDDFKFTSSLITKGRILYEHRKLYWTIELAQVIFYRLFFNFFK